MRKVDYIGGTPSNRTIPRKDFKGKTLKNP